MKQVRQKSPLLAAAMLALLAGNAWCQLSPVGVWKNIDDKSRTERVMIRIVESAGVLTGRVEKILATDIRPDAVCDKCDDDRKNKPLLGLEIIRGVTKSDTDQIWDGGHILDADEGKSYKVRIRVADDGKKLEVRGYIGMPLLGRTQTWLRTE